jgi:hypothetical protein
MTKTEPMTPTDLGRAWAELPGWRWMPGMLAFGRLRSQKGDGERLFRVEPREGHPTVRTRVKQDQRGAWEGTWSYLDVDAYPDPTDPATVGCLHALAEEIVGGPVDVEHIGDRVHVSAGPHSWDASASGPTRAHALYALVLEVSRG